MKKSDVMSDIPKDTNPDITSENKESDSGFIDFELIQKGLNRLLSITSRESELLDAKRYDEALSLTQEKMELLNFFERNSDEVVKVLSDLEKMNEEKRNIAKKLAQNLLDLFKSNTDKVKKAQYINNRVMEITKDYLLKKVVEKKNYSGSGGKKMDAQDPKNIVMDTEA